MLITCKLFEMILSNLMQTCRAEELGIRGRQHVLYTRRSSLVSTLGDYGGKNIRGLLHNVSPGDERTTLKTS